MSDAKPIFDQIRQSEMNDWSGRHGSRLLGMLARVWSLRDHRLRSKLLDFGCGVGGVLLSVLKRVPEVGRITGFDAFCRRRSLSVTPSRNHFRKRVSSANQDAMNTTIGSIAKAGVGTAKSHASLPRANMRRNSPLRMHFRCSHVEMAGFPIVAQATLQSAGAGRYTVLRHFS